MLTGRVMSFPIRFRNFEQTPQHPPERVASLRQRFGPRGLVWHLMVLGQADVHWTPASIAIQRARDHQHVRFHAADANAIARDPSARESLGGNVLRLQSPDRYSANR